MTKGLIIRSILIMPVLVSNGFSTSQLPCDTSIDTTAQTRPVTRYGSQSEYIVGYMALCPTTTRTAKLAESLCVQRMRDHCPTVPQVSCALEALPDSPMKIMTFVGGSSTISKPKGYCPEQRVIIPKKQLSKLAVVLNKKHEITLLEEWVPEITQKRVFVKILKTGSTGVDTAANCLVPGDKVRITAEDLFDLPGKMNYGDKAIVLLEKALYPATDEIITHIAGVRFEPAFKR